MERPATKSRRTFCRSKLSSAKRSRSMRRRSPSKSPLETPAFDLFKPGDTTREKIRALVLLRGKLRHHSLKSPQRWDPNKQNEYEGAARFLGSVVGDIVIKESLDDIYGPAALQSFREISVSTGHETKIKVNTHRLNKERMLALDMSYPTTVLSSKLCLSALRNALQACKHVKRMVKSGIRFDCKRRAAFPNLSYFRWFSTFGPTLRVERSK